MLTLADLTPAQRQRFVATSRERQVPVAVLLADFRRDPYQPGAITGTLPWCGLYGLLEADGRAHT
jgi:hypothetical protein